jgi:hypothetical protein
VASWDALTGFNSTGILAITNASDLPEVDSALSIAINGMEVITQAEVDVQAYEFGNPTSAEEIASSTLLRAPAVVSTDSVTNPVAKDDFLFRIADRDREIATAAVVLVEASHLQVDLDVASALVNALSPDEPAKILLQGKIDLVKTTYGLI